jgi:hypothetical protein
MSIVHDFKSIRRKLERQDQKAEFEAKEEQQRQSYANLYGVMVPYIEDGVVQLKWGSLAHPAWPYTGTGFEWSKFVKVKI